MAIDLDSTTVDTLLASAKTALQAGDYTASLTAMQSAVVEQQQYMADLAAAGGEQKNRLKLLERGRAAVGVLANLLG